MSAPTYTLEQVNEMIVLAMRLGFWDDVRHWEGVRKELQRNAS